MIVNTSELKTFLKKATLNYIINNVQIKLSKDKAISKMISSSSDAISLLNLPNLILPEMKSTDSLVMNFDEPNTNLVPFLNLINDNEETTIQIKDEKITLIQGKQKSNIFFCAPQVVSIFEAEAPRADISYFHQMEIDDDFYESFSSIKKIGSKFNKIYFGVSDNMLYIETSDKQNRFSNGLRIDLCEVDYQDMSMCFDFKNVVNVMSVLSDDFTANFAYVPDQSLGMIFIGNEDNSERYYLMSRTDNA
jgi:hypothetical protein